MYNSLNGESAKDYWGNEESGDHPAFAPTCGVYGVSNNEEVALVTAEGDVLNTYTTGEILVFRGKMTIGTKNTVTPIIARWFLFDNVKLTYARQLTQEEIDAEEEAKAQEEEAKALEGEENADAKWDHDNAENMDKLKEGEEVKMKPTQYDKPIINMKEIKEKLENDRYLVFLDTKGSVVGFNKSTRKYFTIYAGKNGSASGISLAGDNNVLIKTPNGSITYDLVHDKAKTSN
jgi:hypothetical protein